MSGMDIDEVEPDLFASFNGCNESIFDALYASHGHRDVFRMSSANGTSLGP